MMNDEIRQSIEESVLCWLATVNKAGEPNVSPKEFFVADGKEHISIANIASPESVENILQNPKVSLSFIDIFKQKGFKVKGDATILNEQHDEYQSLFKELNEMGGNQFPIKNIIRIKITRFEPIAAPSYILFPEKTTEESQIDQAMDTYGVTEKILIA